MKKELPKAYEPSKYEDEIYKKWEKSGLFNPDNLKGEPFSIMMPPPNVTGVLHLGHALENSLMDIMARYQRMNGKKVLLLPGTDHAAVATQAKVEKLLIEQGIKNPRKELGREKLLEEIRKYSEGSKKTILKQIRKMGTSCDWSRLAYTFDEKRSRAVNEVFVRMYKDGLIYHGFRVINWSVKGRSTCSDDELIYIERPAKLYTFKYTKDFPIPIATTRPETKLGDTAVAVHPKGKWKKYIGKVFTVDVGAAKPLNIKIIGEKNIDESFGTGAVGVTPAHSIVDFEMYEKQKSKKDPIELIQVIGEDGLMNSEAGSDYVNLSVEKAREKFVGWLKKNDLLIKEENISQNVGTSDRFGDIVEVLPMTQWFVAVNKKISGREKTLKDLMKEAVTIGHRGNPKQKVNITPDRFEKIYFNWIDNLRDWCISRQIWWGHRIPVWYCRGNDKGKCLPECHKPIVSMETPKKCPACGSKDLIQDEDTLDTWFSSGLWTFSTLGWPEKTKDLKTFHPTNWMQMGYEILFFWMARMILMSTYTLDEIPFKNVYIHGMVRDEYGKKFSKSKGNTLDPLEVINKYGTDALRFSMISGIAPGNDPRFYKEKVEGGRNLVNKLWNIARYILQETGNRKQEIEINFNNLTLADKYILSRLEDSIKQVTDYLNDYKFSSAGEWLREFTWSDLADWYLEATKFQKGTETEKVLLHVLRNLLQLWHPFMPFVTEAIWKEFNSSDLIIEKWPVQKYSGKEAVDLMTATGGFQLLKKIIIKIRNVRTENGVDNSRKVTAIVIPGIYEAEIDYNQELIKGLRTGIKEIEIKESGEEYKDEINIRVSDGVSVNDNNIDIYLIGAVDKEKEKERIKKEIENLEKLVKNAKMKLGNKEFVAKAPEKVVNMEKDKLKKFEAELKKLKSK